MGETLSASGFAPFVPERGTAEAAETTRPRRLSQKAKGVIAALVATVGLVGGGAVYGKAHPPTIEGSAVAVETPQGVINEKLDPGIHEICRAVSDAEIASLLGGVPLSDIKTCDIDRSLLTDSSQPRLVTSGKWEQKSTGVSVQVWLNNDPLTPSPTPQDPANQINPAYEKFVAGVEQDKAYGAVQKTSPTIFSQNSSSYNAFAASYMTAQPYRESVVAGMTTGDNYLLWMSVSGPEDVRLPVTHDLFKVNDAMYAMLPHIVESAAQPQ